MIGGIYVNRITKEDQSIGERVSIIKGSDFHSTNKSKIIQFDDRTMASLREKLEEFRDESKPDSIFLISLNQIEIRSSLGSKWAIARNKVYLEMKPWWFA